MQNKFYRGKKGGVCTKYIALGCIEVETQDIQVQVPKLRQELGLRMKVSTLCMEVVEGC
jgi:hypothetical protein